MKNAWDEYHNKGGKEKAAKYYAANKEVLREDEEIRYKKIQKDIERRYEIERYHMDTDLNEKLKQ